MCLYGRKNRAKTDDGAFGYLFEGWIAYRDQI